MCFGFISFAERQKIIRLSLGAGRAFSLLELLAVMAIVGLVVALAVPAIATIKGANDITTSSFRLSETLEQARTYAMANNTYVLVGLKPGPAQSIVNASPIEKLWVSVVAARDGTRSYAATNLNQVSRLVQLENVRFADAINPDPARPTDDVKNAPGGAVFGYPITGTSKYLFDQVVEYTPQGIARIYAPSPSLQRGGLLIRIEETQGDKATGADNYAQLQIDSLTGSIRVSRP